MYKNRIKYLAVVSLIILGASSLSAMRSGAPLKTAASSGRLSVAKAWGGTRGIAEGHESAILPLRDKGTRVRTLGKALMILGLPLAGATLAEWRVPRPEDYECSAVIREARQETEIKP